ncbi:MAG: hypothetical protein Tsb0021_03540 [Chlamydiales bacterium]
MKIDNKLLSIPPYISTDWSQVRAIYMKGDVLMVVLIDSDTIQVPGLKLEEIEKVFSSHTSFIEEMYDSSHREQIQEKPSLTSAMNAIPGLNLEANGSNPFQFVLGSSESLNNVLQHNPEQAHLPNLPQEIVQKIATITKALLPDEMSPLSKPEPHCNCVHCQIGRAMNGASESVSQVESEIEEEISEEELQFSQWEVTPWGKNKMFSVKNKLDHTEEYKVCLDPLGCSCGQKGCEHIVTVLKS